MEFKKFLLNEQREYLSSKVGDVLTGVHELVQSGKQVGARQLVQRADSVVSQIRKILHSSWPRTEYKYLRKLQKCGVGLAKCIKDRGDLRDVLNSVRHELEQLSQKLGEPINTLASPKKKEKQDEEQPQQSQQGPQDQGVKNQVPGQTTPIQTTD